MSGTNYLSLRADASFNTTSATVGSMGFSTLVGSTLSANTAALMSTLSVSSLTTGSVGFSTLVGSTMTHHTMTVQSTITASTLTASGNVGIGSTLPVQKLDVNGSASLSGSFYMADGQNFFIGPNTNNAIRLHHITNQSYLDYGSADLNIRSNDGSNVVNDRIMVKQNGNVGIGNNNPNTRLWIAPNITTTTLEGVAQFGGLHLQPNGTNNTITGITFGANEVGLGAERQSQSGIICQSSSAYGSKLFFQTSNAYVDGAKNRMVIDHLGNVGIGTANPTTTLHVHATTTATTTGILSSRFYLSGPGDNQDTTGADQDGPWYGLGWSGIPGLSGTPYVCLAGFSGVAMRSGLGFIQLTGSGNVGIGTTNPAYLLDVNGSARIGGITNNVVLATNTVQITHPNASFVSYNAGYPPNINPIVRNSIAAWYGTRDGVVSRGAAIDFEDVNTNSSFPTAIRGGQIKFYTTSVVQQGVDASLRMTLDVNGNLGIGTATPDYKLKIEQGLSNNSNGLFISNSNYGSMQGLNISMVNAGSGNFNSYAALQGYTSGVSYPTHISLQPSSGNVGIGTTAPANKLHIHTSTNHFKMTHTDNINSEAILQVDSVGNLVILPIQQGAAARNVLPQLDNSIGLGAAFNRWSAVFAAVGTINTSDGKLKEARPLPYGLNEILQVRTILYKWKTQADLPDDHPEKNFEYYGFCADELDPLFPELVYDEEKSAPIQMNYSEMLPVVVNAIKDLSSKVDGLTARNQTLEAENVAIQNHLVSLMTWAKTHGYVPS